MLQTGSPVSLAFSHEATAVRGTEDSLLWLRHLSPTYLFFLLIEVVNYDPNKEVQGEEATKDDEDDEVEVHVQVVFPPRLAVDLRPRQSRGGEEAPLKANPEMRPDPPGTLSCKAELRKLMEGYCLLAGPSR